MASYWQNAKREAKRRAQDYGGYCWVWSNPAIGAAHWREPYLFRESDSPYPPEGVPATADRFGDGPPKPPPLPTLEERVETLERLVLQLMTERN